ncbi:MAG: 4-hydroxy-tetrahydrodipicolinate synthase [Ruminococcaceae bacterium]|nr:4-hydroxy-tetrahydrodipicolinate synthase [Oscillospiraceae bacterium]
MKKTVFEGSGVAIVTPFTKDGVNYEKLGELLEFHVANQTDAVIICGTTGESSTMPDAEHVAVIRYAVEKIAGRMPVIAGTGSNDTAHGVELSKMAQDAGADALLMVTPYYNKATQKGLIQHYTRQANAVDIPCILYNVPSRTGTNIKPETMLALADVENIVGIKEASGDIVQAARIMALCGDRFDLYSGNDDMVVPLLSLGGKGVISVVANVAPRQTHDMVASYLAGDTKKALALQLEMLELVDALFCEVNPIPVKAALNLMGFEVGGYRLPLCEMEEANLAKLKGAMERYGLLK